MKLTMIRYLTTLIALCLSVVSFASETPCLDPLACNFMEEGECFFNDENGEPCVTEGCTIQGACNYDPEADIYDGSCEFASCLGCTDAEACNYDETALYDDATCIYYVDCNGTCGGDWIEDACGNCFSFTVEPIELTLTTCGQIGHSGPSQGQCDEYYGTGVIESNDGIQSILITQSGTYTITIAGAQGGDCCAGTGGFGAMITGELELFEGDVLSVLVGQRGLSGVTNGSGGGGGSFLLLNEELILAAGGGGGGSSSGGNGNPGLITECGGGGDNGWSGGCEGLGGIDNDSDNGAPAGGGYIGNGECLSCYSGPGGAGVAFINGGFGGVFQLNGGFGGGASGWNSASGGAAGGGFSGGGAQDHSNGNGGGGGSFISETLIIVSSSSGANEGDGFVTLSSASIAEPYCNPGCTYPQACNYNPESNFDDGSCDYCFCLEGTQWSDSLQGCVSTAPPLMDACGAGTYWDEESQACLTTVTCAEDLNTDGIVGIADLLQLLSMFGTPCDEVDTSEFTCGDPVNYHGYDYATVQIGGQCWFAENLRTELYQNGDSIPGYLSNDEWVNSTEGAQAVYDNDPAYLIAGTGRLYNGFAAKDSRNLCPSDWHVSTDVDWGTLEMELGMSESEIYSEGWRGTDQGTQLKLSLEDFPNWNGTNTSGFSARPSGRRHYNFGTFSNSTNNCWFWSISDETSYWDFNRAFSGNESVISRVGFFLTEGKSVRCIQDTE